MSINQFMNDNLEIIRDEIINSIPTDTFDSHEFIRHFAKRFEMEYVQMLNNYDSEPFRNVHAQIAKFLSVNQEFFRINATGKCTSPNIFGIDDQNEGWVKTA